MRVLSNLDADLNRIMRVPAPDADMDAVSKAYVEDVSQGIYDDLFAYGSSITFLAARYDILSSGWDIAEIWTYVSPTSFSINGDKRDKYQKGDKIRLTQGGDLKYFYITGVSYSAPNTIVTITGGSDYTLANAAITDNHYSKAMNPQGWPVSLGQRVGDKEIWHEGNDGAGSGLDADTVDTIQASRIIFGSASDGSTSGELDPNNITKSGFYYLLSHANNPNGANGHLIHCHLAAGNGYSMQLFTVATRADLCYIRHQEDGVWGSWYSVINTGNSRRLLWSGTWSSGSISAPGIHQYNSFLIVTSAHARIAVRAQRVPGDTLVLGDGWWGSMQVHTSFNTFTDGATFDGCASKNHPASTVHGASTNYSITAIYGIM